jgi:hypothetical protein
MRNSMQQVFACEQFSRYIDLSHSKQTSKPHQLPEEAFFAHRWALFLKINHFNLTTESFMQSRERSDQSDAEGATAPETLRQKDRDQQSTSGERHR